MGIHRPNSQEPGFVIGNEKMTSLEKLVKDNPKAEQELKGMTDVLQTLQELRQSGVARGSDLKPYQGRQSLKDLKRSHSKRKELKRAATHHSFGDA